MNNVPGGSIGVQQNWRWLYYLGTRKTDFRRLDGTMSSFTTASLNLPKMITRMWVTRQIGESPLIKHGDDVLDNVPCIEDMIMKLYAFGRIIVVPFINDFGDFEYFTLSNLATLDYTLVSGRLTELVYKAEALNEYYQYQLQSSVGPMIRRGTYEDETFNPIEDWQPLLLEPFYAELKINADKYAIPIWGNAYHLIEDVNTAHHEMMLAMNLLRPIVTVPQRVASGSLRHNEQSGEGAIFSDNMRILQSVPNLPEDYSKLDYFGGTFDPQPYTRTINYMLSQIGVLCGLGREALTFESDQSIRMNSRTATEVLYSQNDVYISQNMLNRTTKLAVTKLMREYAKFNNIDPDEIEVTIQDNIIDDEKTRMNMLMEDYQNGSISREFYLSQRYPDENVEDIINTRDTEVTETSNDVEINDNDLTTTHSSGMEAGQNHSPEPRI